MRVKILHRTPINILIQAIRICHKSESKSEEADKQLIKKIIELGHESVLEHITFTFHISEVSRALLQQLARHRLASLSVQSTRYTLKKILNKSIDDNVILTGYKDVDIILMKTIKEITNIKENIPNDILKYALPEAWKTEFIWSINARSLRNFLSLRLDKKAHWEIRTLAQYVFEIVYSDEETKILFEDLIKKFYGEK